jgi:hypothetical protein
MAHGILWRRAATQGVRNRCVAGVAALRVGRRREPIHVTELEDDAKRRWPRETGQCVGVDANASDEALRRRASDHPVFRMV